MYGTRPFFGWDRAQGRGIPLFGAPQAPGDKPNPSEEGLSLGGRPPEARGDVSSGGTHPTELRNATTAGRERPTTGHK